MARDSPASNYVKIRPVQMCHFGVVKRDRKTKYVIMSTLFVCLAFS